MNTMMFNGYISIDENVFVYVCTGSWFNIHIYIAVSVCTLYFKMTVYCKV